MRTTAERRGGVPLAETSTGRVPFTNDVQVRRKSNLHLALRICEYKVKFSKKKIQYSYTKFQNAWYNHLILV
jgi:hypothetical protein